MKKFVLALATLAMLWSAAPVFAAECAMPATAYVTEAKANNLKVLDMTGDVMKNFMSFFEATAGPAPVDFDQVVLIYDGVGAKVSLFQDGCFLLGTGTFSFSIIQPFLKEANLDG